MVKINREVEGSSPSRTTIGMFPVLRSGKTGRGRGDERIALFGNGFLGTNCYRYLVYTARIAVRHLYARVAQLVRALPS